MNGTDIKSDCLAKLDDAAGIHWTDANLLLWINEGGRDIVTHKPKAGTVRALTPLTANVTKQALPALTIAVLDLSANMGSAGTTPGRAITPITEERLRAVRPSWRSELGPLVKHLVVDERDPGFFYVWPGPTVAMQVDALLQKQYAPIAALANALPLDDTYRTPLADYVMSQAYSMEGDDQNLNLAGAYYAKYAQYLGIQIQKQKRASVPANSNESPTFPMTDKNGS